MDNAITIINIPWEDVLFKKVLPYLTIRDLFNLRSTSNIFTCLVNSYLVFIQSINLVRHKNFNNVAFQVWIYEKLRCVRNNSFHLQVLLSYCRNVRILNLSRCSWIDENDVKLFFENNPKIVQINLSHSLGVVNRVLQTLVVNCKKLKKINLSYSDLSVGALESIIFHLDDLHTVDLSKCPLLTEKCLVKLVVKFHNIKNLFLMDVPAVSDRVLITISQHCKKLENLNIDKCTVNMSIIR